MHYFTCTSLRIEKTLLFTVRVCRYKPVTLAYGRSNDLTRIQISTADRDLHRDTVGPGQSSLHEDIVSATEHARQEESVGRLVSFHLV